MTATLALALAIAMACGTTPSNKPMAAPAAAQAKAPAAAPAKAPAAAPAEPMSGAMSPDEMKWGPAPAVFQAGAQMAVIQGNPMAAGPYVVRLKMPDGYKIMPHWHPTTENVTVISGTFHVGMGDKFDESTAKTMPPGSFGFLGPHMNHFAWATGPTEVQVHGMGPFQLTYVNPADDPSKAAAK